MKNHRIIVIIALTLIAVVSLFSCRKVEVAGSESESYAFKAGQKVRLTVSASTDSNSADSRVSSSIVTGSTASYLQFNWEANDTIKVTVNGSSAPFVLVTTSGTPTGTFEGIMPASGSDFSVRFPYNEVQETDLYTQTYQAGGVPHNKMMFYKDGCTLTNTVSLECQYAALKLNLKSYPGVTNLKVGKIVVADSVCHKTFTLNCPSGGILLNDTNTIPFYFVVPEFMTDSKEQHIYNWAFDVRIYDDLDDPITCLRRREGKVPFANGRILNMEHGVLKKDGFTVGSNVLYFAKGNLKWDGSKWGFEDTQYARPTSLVSHDIGHFYWVPVATSNPSNYHLYDYLSYASDYDDSSISAKSSADILFCGVFPTDPFQVDKKNYAAMKQDQWEFLLGLSSFCRNNAKGLYKTKVNVCGVANCLVIAPDNYPPSTIQSSYDAFEWASAEAEGLVCLPPAGIRDKDGIKSDGIGEYYWISDCDQTSAKPDPETPYCLDILQPAIVQKKRSNGFPIRLAHF